MIIAFSAIIPMYTYIITEMTRELYKNTANSYTYLFVILVKRNSNECIYYLNWTLYPLRFHWNETDLCLYILSYHSAQALSQCHWCKILEKTKSLPTNRQIVKKERAHAFPLFFTYPFTLWKFHVILWSSCWRRRAAAFLYIFKDFMIAQMNRRMMMASWDNANHHYNYYNGENDAKREEQTNENADFYQKIEKISSCVFVPLLQVAL